MDQLRYDGRVAIVTGGARGIGREHVRILAERGAKVVIADLGGAIAGGGADTTPADQAVAEVAADGGEAVACYADVSDPAGAASIVQTALDTYGKLDILVNNAGTFDPGFFDELEPAQYQSMLDVHFFGTLHTCRAAWPHMVAAGYGRIVNTASESVIGNVDRSANYATAKGAIFSFTKELAQEGRPLGIRVNAIAPRAATRMSEGRAKAIEADPNMPEGAADAFREMLHPRHAAPAVGFLAHESCELEGEVLIAGMQRIYRLALVRSVGLTKDSGVVTPEDIVANLDSIMDLTDGLAQTPFSMDA
ncbi:MAG TPA: SDR family NAD(P)-dependent oxidoreductase [Acidimicrobiales bacterium]